MTFDKIKALFIKPSPAIERDQVSKKASDLLYGYYWAVRSFSIGVGSFTKVSITEQQLLKYIHELEKGY